MSLKSYFYLSLMFLFVSKNTSASLLPSLSSQCATFIVSSNKDSNDPGTLRHAINLLNQSNLRKTALIYFTFPEDQTHIIKLHKKLPTIKKPVEINGRTLSLTDRDSTALVGNAEVAAAITVDQSCAEKCRFSNLNFYNVEFPRQISGIYAVNKEKKCVDREINTGNCQVFFGLANLSMHKEKTEKTRWCCSLFS